MMELVYQKVKQPKPDGTNRPVMLSDETMRNRYDKVFERMVNAQLDTLIIYADLEHGSNFEYLTGFLPRFEEALLILHRNQRNYMLMGNENLNKVAMARIKATPIHVPYFSLPNQPMDNTEKLSALLAKADIKAGSRVGIAGWKNFTSTLEDNQAMFDLPSYLLEEIRLLVGTTGTLSNAASIFIGEHGARCTNTVNELAHYEFGAALASDCMLKAMNHLDVGVSEMALGEDLNAGGQRNSVVTIASAGKRFIKANLYPTQNQVTLGDAISLTVGYKGGLSSRAGYAVYEASQLPSACQDYVETVVKPYFHAVATWLTQVHCGCTGGNIYQIIEDVLPKAIYHWSLCPGHLTADEEWMSSPIYESSTEVLESGMLFQIDIIPSVKGYAGVSAESTIALADEVLRAKIAEQEPALWQRIQQRRAYLQQELHLALHPDILPMCATVAYLRPFLLAKDMAMTVTSAND